MPIYWGNRNWHPLLPDTLAPNGRRRRPPRVGFRDFRVQLVFRMPPVSGRHRAGPRRSGARAPAVRRLRTFFNHPLFIETVVNRLQEALERIPAERRRAAHLFFTAHSIPESMATTSDYVRQIEETCSLAAQRLQRGDWQIVYQSRSGAPGQPWLGPDIVDAIATLPPGCDAVVMPVGFVSDHMEVIYDLDHDARLAAERAGVNLVRAATPGTHPAFIAMIRELIRERTDNWPPRAVGDCAPAVCQETCCPPPPARRRGE